MLSAGDSSINFFNITKHVRKSELLARGSVPFMKKSRLVITFHSGGIYIVNQ